MAPSMPERPEPGVRGDRDAIVTGQEEEVQAPAVPSPERDEDAAEPEEPGQPE